MTGALWVHDGTQVRPVHKRWWEAAPQTVQPGSAVTVTAHSSAHTKGAWTELIDSTQALCDCIRLQVSNIGVNATNTATLIDVALGAAGAEVPVASNVAVGGAHSTVPYAIVFDLPVKVPAGSRVSARIQSVVTGGKAATVQASLCASPTPAAAPTSVDVLGTSTSTSAGTSLTSAATWVEVVASSARAYQALVLVPSVSASNVTAATAYLQAGVGAAGAEVQVGQVRWARTGAELAFTQIWTPGCVVPAWIPAGSRISLRDSAGGAGVAGTLIGVPA